MARLPASSAYPGPVNPPRKTYSFSDFSKLAPSAPIPGDRLDTELHELRASLTAAVDALNGILRGVIPLPEHDVELTIPGMIGTKIVDIHTGQVDGGKRVLPVLQPLIDATPRAQQLLNDAAGAADQAEKSRQAANRLALDVSADAHRLHQAADGAETHARQAQELVDTARQISAQAQDAVTAFTNDENHASLAAFDAAQAEQLAWKWAEYLSGPVMTEAEYEAIDPDLIPPGYTYNPVTGMGTAGLWSSKWWAVTAQQKVLEGSDFATDAAESAADSAQAAADAAAAAEEAAAAAEALGDLYLGAHASAPITDNDGEALLTGAMYYNSTSNILYVWDGDSWNAVTTPSGSGVAASAVISSPVGNVSATNVQAAIQELDAEKVPEAPNDGGIYGRQSLAWVSVVDPSVDWSEIVGKPATFPPSPHSHPISDVTGLQAQLDLKATVVNLNAEASARAAADTTITTNYQAADATLTTNLATEVTNRTNADTALQTQINTKVGPDAPSDGKQYARFNATWAQVAGGAGITDAPPSSPLPGQLWWESDTGQMWIYYYDGDSYQWVQVNSTDITGKVSKSGDTMTGSLAIKPTSGESLLYLDKPASGQGARLYGRNNGVNRWQVVPGNANVESTGNLGSDFQIGRHDDSGTYIDAPIVISRATGLMTANLIQPNIMAHRAGAGSVGITAGAWQKINIGTVTYNIGGWTTSGGSLVVPKGGMYMIGVSTAWVTAAAATTLMCGIGINNVLTGQGASRVFHSTAQAVNWTINTQRPLSLAAGNTLEILALATVGGSSVIDTGSETFIWAYLMCAQ